MVKKLNITVEQAMDMLDVPQKDRKNVMDMYRIDFGEENTVSIFEYDEEKELRLLREAEREYGIEIGMEKGKEEERVANIKKVMINLNLTAEQAMDVLEIPEEKREEYSRL